jgi:hypothetical protein
VPHAKSVAVETETLINQCPSIITIESDNRGCFSEWVLVRMHSEAYVYQHMRARQCPSVSDIDITSYILHLTYAPTRVPQYI